MEMKAFLFETLGLELRHERDGFAAYVAPDGSRIEVFAPDYPDHDHFSTGPVGGFEVSDIEAARQLISQSNCQLLSEVGGRAGGTRWFHFRGPDGNTYEMVHHPDISQRTAAAGVEDHKDG
jgi:catechol 2,3-dioxygenase-like lactoylglutathione lyase family enzyme